MNRRLLMRHSFQLALAALLTLTAPRAGAATGTLSGPFTHQNLEIFLVHGATQLEERRYATLNEALAGHDVVVNETGNVNELSIENPSKTLVFLNAGDIVKGGRQDRTAKDDLILPPQSGKVALAAFCVEHGRWTGRANDNALMCSARGRSESPPATSRTRARFGAVWLSSK